MYGDGRVRGKVPHNTNAWSSEVRSKAAGCAQLSAKAALVLGHAFTLMGCAAIRDITESVYPSWAVPAQGPRVSLDRTKSVFVALPADAESPSGRYVGSGQLVGQAVAEAFAGHGIAVEVGKKRLTNDEAMAFAAQINAGYVVLPIITRWEQRNRWLGVPSRLALWVSVVETPTRRVIMAEKVKSWSIEPLAFTIENPGALLEQPLSRYVASLY